jgi:hypothetical protein
MDQLAQIVKRAGEGKGAERRVAYHANVVSVEQDLIHLSGVAGVIAGVVSCDQCAREL